MFLGTANADIKAVQIIRGNMSTTITARETDPSFYPSPLIAYHQYSRDIRNGVNLKEGRKLDGSLRCADFAESRPTNVSYLLTLLRLIRLAQYYSISAYLGVMN